LNRTIYISGLRAVVCKINHPSLRFQNFFFSDLSHFFFLDKCEIPFLIYHRKKYFSNYQITLLNVSRRKYSIPCVKWLHWYQYQFLVAMILYVQVTVSQYYLKSANAVPVIRGNSNINLFTERSWNRGVNRLELICEIVKITTTFMRSDYALLKNDPKQ